MKAPLPAGTSPDAEATLNTVDCPAADNCFAAGVYYADGRTHELTEHYSAGTWTPTEVALPPDGDPSFDAQLTDISCGSTSMCAAAGYYPGTSGSFYKPLLTAWDGTRWQTVDVARMPGLPGGGYGILNGVSCPTADFCVATGALFTGPSQGVPLLVTWDGHAWTATAGPVTTGGGDLFELTDVDCAVKASCVAVGYRYLHDSSQPPFVEVLQSGTWTPKLLGTPNGDTTKSFAEPKAISCAAVGSCTFTGWYEKTVSPNSEDARHGLVETLASGSWTSRDVMPPDSELDSDAQMTDVACPAVQQCVGAINPLGAPSRLVQVSSGAVFPTSITEGKTVTLGVACVGVNTCLGVGWREDESDDWHALLQRLSGTTVSTFEAPSLEPGDLVLRDTAAQSASAYVAVGNYMYSYGYLLAGIPASN